MGDATMQWGLLGPDFLPAQRRLRTLGVGSTVRLFNELAVPGLGGLWFGKQALLAILGIFIAQEAMRRGKQVSNIEASNALEALACALSFEHTNWRQDERLRGRIKLNGRRDHSFSALRKRSAYVVQPMRMRVVQPLLALGLVTSDGGSQRFNNYRCAQPGLDFIETACGAFRPNKRSIADNLVRWMNGDDCVSTPPTRQALSPIEPLAQSACKILRERMATGGAVGERRRIAMQWVGSLSKDTKLSWSLPPAELASEHWRDLHAGGIFFRARDAALDMLEAVEAHLSQMKMRGLELGPTLPERIGQAVSTLRAAAQAYVDFGHDPIADGSATAFCRDCLFSDPAETLRALVRRDGRVLRLVGDLVLPGAAFRDVVDSPGASADEARIIDGSESTEETGITTEIAWPENMSFRMANLFLLNLDLNGGLSAHLDGGSNVAQ